MPKFLAVVGGKHSGKTTIIENLIVELKCRGYHVGTIKEVVRVSTVDIEGKETDRYAKAGAETIIASPREETVVFIKKKLSLKEMLPYLTGLDYVLLEGFETKKILPKAIAAKTAEEVKSYLDDSVIAISGLIMDSPVELKKISQLKIPLLKSTAQIVALAGLVERKAIELKNAE